MCEWVQIGKCNQIGNWFLIGKWFQIGTEVEKGRIFYIER